MPPGNTGAAPMVRGKVSQNPAESCTQCGKGMAKGDKFCAACGHPKIVPAQGRKRRRHSWLLVAAGIVLLLVIAAMVGNNLERLSPGNRVVITQDTVGYMSKDGFQEFAGISGGSGPGDFIAGKGYSILVRNGSRAEILKSFQFTSGGVSKTGVQVRVLNGTCSTRAGDFDFDCSNEVLWVDKLYIKADQRSSNSVPSKSESPVSAGVSAPLGAAGVNPAGDPIFASNQYARTTNAWRLLKNPYRRKGSLLLMDMRPQPALPGQSFKFNRMISDNVALYDYTGGSDEGDLEGQIAVIIDQSSFRMGLGPSTDQTWKVEPMGVLKGTNLLGAAIQVPLIKFWGYCDYWKYANMGLGDPCMQDMSSETIFGVPMYPGATRLSGNEGFDVYASTGGQQVEADYETPDSVKDVMSFYKDKFGSALKLNSSINAFGMDLDRGDQRTDLSIVPCELSRLRPSPWCSQGTHGTRIRLHEHVTGP